MKLAGPMARPKALLITLATMVCLLALAGCAISEQKGENGQKKVDIQTPFANLKVNTEVDANDTGLPLYPGARRKPRTPDNEHGANVNISGMGFGLKVAVVEFLSDDPPQKVLDFYRGKLKTMGGKFLECQHEFMSYTRKHDEHELTCESGNSDGVELKVGRPENQHIVAVKPNGSGSDFALVFVQTRGGKEGEL